MTDTRGDGAPPREPHLKLVRSDGQEVRGAPEHHPSESCEPESEAGDGPAGMGGAVPAEAGGLDAPATAITPEFREQMRIVEAVLFASAASLHESRIAQHLPEGADLPAILAQLEAEYATRGVNLKKAAGRWMFRTADDLGHLLVKEVEETRRLSKAAQETLAIVAYHQPVTRAEIEEIRGVSTSSGTLDILLETGWVRMRGRRRAPGRPVTYGTTDAFLEHFGLEAIRDLPGLGELKGSGLLDPTMPTDFDMPQPTDVADLLPDELPLEDDTDDDATDTDLFEDDADDAAPTSPTGDAAPGDDDEPADEPEDEPAPGSDRG